MRQLAISIALFTSLFAACGGSDNEPIVTVVKSVESIQCQTVPPSIAQLDADLSRAGIVPAAKSCASDAKDRSFACGVPVLYLRVIEIPSSQSDAASALGYKPRESYNSVIPISC